MDLTLTGPEQALADECRAWLRANLPWEYGRGRPPHFDDLAAEVAFGRDWQRTLREGRWVGVAWPEEYGGRDAGPIGHYIVTEELARGPRAGARRPHRDQPGGPHDPRPRHRRAARPVAPADPLGRGDLVPALQRAGRRQRPVVALDPRAPRRRRVGARRPEGVDELRAVRRLGRLSGPHRSRRPEVEGHLLPRRRHARRRVSRSARCARSPTSPSSTRCSSPRSSSPRTASSDRSTRVGGSPTRP